MTPEPGAALRHARAAWELGERDGWSASAGYEEFDRPFALEALARAHACAGDPTAATGRWLQASDFVRVTDLFAVAIGIRDENRKVR